MEEAKIAFEILKWVGSIVLRFLAGDEGPEPKRLLEVLPPQLRADLEHARQKRLLEEELRRDLSGGPDAGS